MATNDVVFTANILAATRSSITFIVTFADELRNFAIDLSVPDVDKTSSKTPEILLIIQNPSWSEIMANTTFGSILNGHVPNCFREWL